MGKYFDFPDPGLGINADDIAKPILLFQAAKAAKRKADLDQAQFDEQMRHQRAAEEFSNRRVASEEFRANEAHRAAMQREAMAVDEMRRKQALDLAQGLPSISDALNPASPKYNPGVGNATASALGINGLHQVLPQRPVVPSLSAPPEELRRVLQQGTALSGIEGQGNEAGGQLPNFDRPPSEAEFQKYAGHRGQGPLGPEQYGETGEEGPLAPGDTREELLNQGRARQAFRNPMYEAAAKDYLGKRQSALAEDSTYQSRLDEAQRNPRYEGTSSVGPVTLEPVRQQEGVKRAHDEAANRINELAGSIDGVDPYTANEVRIVARKVAMQLVSPDQANKDLNFLFQQRMGVEKAKEMAKAGAGRAHAFGEGNDIKREQLFNQQFQQVLTNFGWKGDVGSLKDLADAKTQLGTGNAALDTSAGASFAKKANGAGVLTDADYARFWLKMGGVGSTPWTNVDDAVDYIWSGKIPSSKRKIVMDAIDQKMGESVKRLSMVRDRADSWASKQDPSKQEWYGNLRAGYFDWLPESRKQAPQVGAASKAGAGAKEQKLLEWYNGPEGKSAAPELRARAEKALRAKGLL